MSRPIRIERAGGWYHVTARGNERRPIFRDNRDRQHFCELLEQTVNQFRLHLHCFVLMEWLNSSYSAWFNRRRGRSGHLFQGRFKSILVDREQWGLELSRYVHLNPVRVGRLGLSKSERKRMGEGVAGKPDQDQVQKRIAELRRYRWSSYRAYVGLGKQPEWLECQELLKLGGGAAGKRAEAYRKYVEGAVREGLDKSPWEELHEQVVLGSELFLNQIRKHVRGDRQEQRRAKRLAAARPRLEQVIECVEGLKGEKWEAFRERHGDRGRDLILHLGRKLCGLKLNELARVAGLNDYAAVGMAVSRYGKRLKHDAVEQKQLRQVSQMLNVEM